MATPTKLDIQAVKDAMAKTPWLNYVDAARQVRWVQNPVAPVLPTPAPLPANTSPESPTKNVNLAQREANIASRQAQIQAGTIPAVWTSVTPQAEQVQAPALVVEPVTPVTPKADATPWITQDAFQQAKSESEKIKVQNDAIMAQNKQKSDLAREDLKLATDQKTAEAKQAQDQANTALANDEVAIFNTLKVGGMIPEAVKSSPFYKSAQDTFNKVRAFSTYSVNNLVWAMNNGSLLPGTKLYNELLNDPAMKQKLTEAQTFTAKQPVDLTKVTQNVSDSILSSNPTLATALADWVITMDEYNQATNNPEVVAKAKDVETKTNKYNELKAEYDGIEDQVNAQFPGSPFADSIIADRQKAKYKNLVLAKWEVDSAIGTMTELKSQASSLFDKNLELYKQRQSDEAQIAKEQRDMQSKKDLLQYQTDFEKKQAELALQDPATAIKSVMDEY